VFLFSQALKAMVEERYHQGKREAKALVQQATAVSLTSDMWTSMNMEAYLAVTCHFIADGVLNTTLLGVQHFPQSHTAHNLAEAKGAIMEEWCIRHKVTCLVTDAASNMLACGRELHLKQAICLFQMREAVSAAMASLPCEVTMLTPMEFTVIKECLGVFGPFNEATI
jgi:hypothetical protein